MALVSVMRSNHLLLTHYALENVARPLLSDIRIAFAGLINTFLSKSLIFLFCAVFFYSFSCMEFSLSFSSAV